jgi:hypothetical protein
MNQVSCCVESQAVERRAPKLPKDQFNPIPGCLFAYHGQTIFFARHLKYHQSINREHRFVMCCANLEVEVEEVLYFEEIGSRQYAKVTQKEVNYNSVKVLSSFEAED